MAIRIVLDRNRLRAAAASAGMCLRGVARALEIAPGTLSQKARGQRGWQRDELAQLERLLSVSVNWLAENDLSGAA